MRWFTADPHYFHESVIQFGKRPFATLEEMHEALISRWNARVTRKDEVFVIGDFAWRNKAADNGDLASIFHRLNGKKTLIVGNHDNKAILALPWTEVSYRKGIKENGNRVWMSHNPERSWNDMYKGSYHFYGHEHGNVVNYSLHNNAVGKGGSCDVGVDCWDWKPVSFEEVVDRIIKTGKPNPDLFDAQGNDRTKRKTEE
jgi:calcineurin-like phosphoesterase family protein